MSVVPAWQQQPIHRILVKYYKDGIEEVHSFGTHDLAIKFAENFNEGTTKYFGPNTPLPERERE